MVSGQITVTSYNRAKRIKRRGFCAVITIEDPGIHHTRQLRFYGEPKMPQLVLQFEDIDSQVKGIKTATLDDIRLAIEFARSNVGALLIHCHAGVSRSTAVAMAIIADRLGPFCEAQALRDLLEIVPYAVPNLLVVRYADEVLDRGGRLLEAVSLWDSAQPENQLRRRLTYQATLKEYFPAGTDDLA